MDFSEFKPGYDESSLINTSLEIEDPLFGLMPIEDHIREMLHLIGEDPQREGLQRTPERVARMTAELVSGYQKNLDQLVNGAVFETEHKDMILVRDIQYFSLCEHHLLPFFGVAHVAYIPDGKIIGLSKIPRIVDMYARRLQVQERLTDQVAETLWDILKPRGVAVYLEGSHMCSMMRGVKQIDAHMVTNTFLGSYESDQELQTNFYRLIKAEK